MFDNEFNSIYWAVNEDLILACKQVASKRKYNGETRFPQGLSLLCSTLSFFNMKKIRISSLERT